MKLKGYELPRSTSDIKLLPKELQKKILSVLIGVATEEKFNNMNETDKKLLLKVSMNESIQKIPSEANMYHVGLEIVDGKVYMVSMGLLLDDYKGEI